MSQKNRDGFDIAGIYFACMDDLEEYCFEHPDFEEHVCICEYLRCVKEDIDTYCWSIYVERCHDQY